MRKKQLTLILLVLFGSFLSMSFLQCKKSCVPGTGGDVTLIIIPQHHGSPIPSLTMHPDSVFIKFNATDFPGISPSSYNMVLAGNLGENFIRASGLKCGQYYIYATGFDTTINLRVAGGIPFNFSQTSGQLSVYIPVTE